MQTLHKYETALDHAILAYTKTGPERMEGPIDVPVTQARMALRQAIILLAQEAVQYGSLRGHTCMHLAYTCDPELQALIPATARSTTTNPDAVQTLVREDPYRFFAMARHGFRVKHQYDGMRAVEAACALLNDSPSLSEELTEAIAAYVFPILTIGGICDVIADDPDLAKGPAAGFVSTLIKLADKTTTRRHLEYFMLPTTSDLGCVIYALLGYRATGSSASDETLRARLMAHASSHHGRLRLKAHFGSVDDVIRGPKGLDLEEKIAEYNRDGTRAQKSAQASSSQ